MKLIIEDDEGRKTVVPFIRDEISIGRLEGNTIRLTERNVSRRHARLLRRDDAIIIEDLGSYTGVRVNGERIASQAPVGDGDLIEIGDYDLAIEGAPARGARDTEPPARAEGYGARDGDTAITPLSAVQPRAQKPAAATTKKLDGGGDVPRLVGLGGAYEGAVFPLDHSPIVVGRTESGNDIALDHPSISRRHARLELQDGVWKIFDLNSANGVEVNGQRGSASPLRSGDTVEIGHLKFRFATPAREGTSAESTIPPRARPEEPAPPAPSRSRLPVVIGGVIALAVAAMAIFIVGPHLQKPAKAPEAPVEDMCRKGQAAASGRDWDGALKAFEAAKQLGQACAFPLAAAEDDARHNQAVKKSLDQAEQLIASRKFKDGIALLEAIPADSIYGADAKVKAAQARSEGVKQLSDDARASIEHGWYDEASGFIDELKQLAPDSPSIGVLQDELAERRKSSPSQPNPHPRHSEVASAAPSGESKPEPSLSPAQAAVASAPIDERNAAAESDIADGIKKIQAGDLPGGIARLQAAIAEHPDMSIVARAHRNIGVAYAHAQRMDEAIPHLKIYVKLDPTSPERDRVLKIIQDYEARKSP